MKSAFGFALATVMSLALIGHAPLARAEEASTWDRLSTTVKVKVQEWMGYFGQATPSAPPAENPAANVNHAAPSAPVQPSVNPVVPVSTAPVPQAKVIVSRPRAPDLAKLRESIRQKSIVQVASPGRKGQSQLAQNSSGVPLTDWRNFRGQGKILPKLDIGLENSITRTDFTLDAPGIVSFADAETERLPLAFPVSASESAKILSFTPARVLGARGLEAHLREVGSPPDRQAIDRIQFHAHEINKVALAPYKLMSDEELKMVAALLLFQRGDHCHMVMGLLSRLASAEKTRSEAHYYLGRCASELKMNQVAFDNLSYLVGRADSEFGSQALELMARNLPPLYEPEFYSLYKSTKKFSSMVTPKSQDFVNYRLAKGAYRAGDFRAAMNFAKDVPEKADFGDDARIVTALAQFALGEKPAAQKTLLALREALETRTSADKNIRALVEVNLGRLAFGQKKYDEAFKAYMRVPKDHPLWVQALIEQGWTQLALADNAGAIGNMYSLHSPYFKAVYQPESFVVRAIGYLNICQYGDAYRTLTWLEKDYREMFEKADQYFKSHTGTVAVYDTVKTYIKGKSTENIEGVPYQVWRDLARRKDFLNLQTALNDKQDESHRYDGVNQSIKQEKVGIRARAETSKKRFDQFKAQVVKVRNVAGVVHGREEWEAGMKRERENAIGYRFQLQLLEISREGFLDFQKQASMKLEHETESLTSRAGRSLASHAADMSTQMHGVLENNEFLRYEVFSGSGEDIRYQVAGGQVGRKDRIPASIKPAKMLNWSFDGEFWEDEIGSYRSSLRNVCPSQPGMAGPAQVQAAGEDEDAN